MPRPPKSGAPRVYLGSYSYLPGFPASEQPPVLRVASRLRVLDPSRAHLTETELGGLVSVYHRLYRVPRVTQERLQSWYDWNRELADSWTGLSDFWNTCEEDASLGLEPRPCGIPPAARAISTLSREDEQQDGDSDEKDDDSSMTEVSGTQIPKPNTTGC